MWNVVKEFYQLPELQEINRLPMANAGIPVAEFGKCPETSPLKLSLDGEWKFMLCGSVAEVPETFAEPGFDDAGWGTIPVPSNWTCQDKGDIPIHPYRARGRGGLLSVALSLGSPPAAVTKL